MCLLGILTEAFENGVKDIPTWRFVFHFTISHSCTKSNSQHKTLTTFPELASTPCRCAGSTTQAVTSCHKNEVILFLTQGTTSREDWHWVLMHMSTIPAPGRTKHPEARLPTMPGHSSTACLLCGAGNMLHLPQWRFVSQKNTHKTKFNHKK